MAAQFDWQVGIHGAWALVLPIYNGGGVGQSPVV